MPRIIGTLDPPGGHPWDSPLPEVAAWRENLIWSFLSIPLSYYEVCGLTRLARFLPSPPPGLYPPASHFEPPLDSPCWNEPDGLGSPLRLSSRPRLPPSPRVVMTGRLGPTACCNYSDGSPRLPLPFSAGIKSQNSQP